jgi:hypothetical protein
MISHETYDLQTNTFNMKRISTLLVAFFVAFSLLAYGGGEKSVESTDNSLKVIEAETEGLKSYILKAKATVNGVKYNSTIWHNVAAEKLAGELETLVTFPSGSALTKTLEIIDGEWTYYINLMEQTGRKVPKTNSSSNELIEQAKYPDENTFRKLIEAKGGRIVGNETFFERNCLVVEIGSGEEKTTTWYYKGIPLRMVSHLTKIEVTHLEENVAIPDEKFDVPAGITIR